MRRVGSATDAQRARRRTALLSTGLVATILIGAVACSSGPSSPSQKQLDDNAETRAYLSVMQFVIDTGQIASADIPAGTLADGIVTQSLGTRMLHIRDARLYISSQDHINLNVPTIDEEIPRVSRLLSAPGPTSDAAAGAVVVQELFDGGYFHDQSLPFDGMTDNGSVQPNASVAAWLAAHASDPLSPGASVTVRQEKQRVAGFVVPLNATYSSGASGSG